MTKNQLIQLLYYKNNMLTRKLISQTVDLILDEISKGIQEQKSVEIRGFGRFKNKTRKSKTLRHPKTGKLIEIAPYNNMSFSYSKKALEN